MPDDLLKVTQAVKIPNFLSRNDTAWTIITAARNFETVKNLES